MGGRPSGASLLLGILCALLCLAGLGRTGLSDPDEGRNAEVAREMLGSGDWVTPRINDARYLDKPPLFFWLVAASYRLLGVNETAARLPSAASAIAAVSLTVWFVRRRMDRRTGLMAGFLLALTPIYIVFARLVIFDMLLLLCMTASVVAFFEAMEGEKSGRPAAAAGFLAAGAGTLTKGPVALAVPLAVMVVWALVRRRPGLLLRLRWVEGLLIFLAVVGPWIWLAESRNPGFLGYALLGENLARMAANPYDTQRPIHFYLKVIAPGMFPWIALLIVQGVRALWRRARRGRAAGARAVQHASPPPMAALTTQFVAVWLLVLLSFFSLVASKRPSYVLPCAVPIAILAARLVARACPGREDGTAPDGEARADMAWGAGIVAGVCLLGGVAAIVIGPALRSAAVVFSRHAPLAEGGLFHLTAGGLLAAAVLLFLVRRARRAWVFVAVSAMPLLCMMPLARAAARQIESSRSSRDLSRFLEQRLASHDKVICFEEYRPGLNFYLRRPIYQVTRAGRIFTSNYIEKHLDQFREEPGFRLLSREALREAILDPGSTTYVLSARKEYGPLFEAAGVPLLPIWEQGGFGLFVRAGGGEAPAEAPGAADSPGGTLAGG